MVKKTISFTLILIVLFLAYQYLVNMMKTKHNVTYYINKDEVFTIDEEYTKEKTSDFYLIKVSTKDKNFVFKINNSYNKQKNIVEDIEEYEQDGYYCIGLNLVGKDKYSFPECIKDNVLYSYESIKDQIDLNDYVSKIVDKDYERYKKDSSKVIESNLLISRDYIDSNEIFMVYGYKMVSLHYTGFSRVFSFSSLDNYKNSFGTLVGSYYVVPRLTSNPTFSTLVKYEIIDGIKKEIELPIAISKQSYVNGVYDNKLYIFDVSNKRQYEIDPYNDTVNIVGTIDEEGVNVVNGEKTSISVYDLEKSTVTFEDKIDDYSSIEYDSIIVGDGLAVYSKDGNYYKVYRDFLDVPVLLFSEPEAHNVLLKGDNVYYIKENSINKCNDYGIFEVISGNEFIYNYENIFDVYLK